MDEEAATVPSTIVVFNIGSEYEFVKELGSSFKACACAILIKHKQSKLHYVVKRFSNINDDLIVWKRCLRELKNSIERSRQHAWQSITTYPITVADSTLQITGVSGLDPPFDEPGTELEVVLEKIKYFGKPRLRKYVSALCLDHPDLLEQVDLLDATGAEKLADLLDKKLIIPNSLLLPRGAVQLEHARPEASGGFADVWRGVFQGHAVAFKVVRAWRTNDSSMNDPRLKDFYQEAILSEYLGHPNISSIYGIDQTTFLSQVALVSDWMPQGTVLNYLAQFPNANRLRLALDIATGLQYLHEMHIVHGVIKSANILVNQSREACISDFGLAAMHYSSKLVTMSLTAGSVRWMSPELIDPEQYGVRRAEATPFSDIYDLSMVLWKMFTGWVPYFEFKKDAQVMSSILRDVRPRRPTQAAPLGLSDDVGSLMEACRKVEWKDRPSMEVILARLREALMLQSEAEATLITPMIWPLELNVETT
ncbi:hypothetical protein CERSUDRAFT_92218 [Gelatoporia subvermispora B]|uniref:Protein kinase domain-containing protein n=1 Tax=Ceriporiopsis subvermispora (strain B) TaxID=914234 RepID=M2R568_CERS8|nr:hypothetical protein CERSUDRAFT_92218 [Gelatoporia subvermispora B]